MSYNQSQKHPLAGKRIIVSGAGLAGLSFARTISNSWPSNHPKPEVVLYERSTEHLDKKRTGYTMGIKPGTGMMALERMGLLDLAVSNKTTGASGESLPPSFWAKDWTPLLGPKKTSKSDSNETVTKFGIRLVRFTLRQMLLDSVTPTTKINWSTAVEDVKVLPSGRVQVTLGNGSTDECDLLIAADGANSRIRTTLLPEQHLDYIGAVCFLGTSHFPNGKPEFLREDWGMNISGEGVPFLTFPIDANSGVWAMSYRSPKPRERIRGDDAIRRQQEILSEVRERGKMFAEPFNEFISATDPETLTVFNAMQKLPIVHAKEIPNANIVFIGDSNHPMSPFSGNGANMALADAVQLAQQLIDLAPGMTARNAIVAFDAQSVPRSTKAVKGSWIMIQILHARGLVYWLMRCMLAIVSLFTPMKV